MNNFNCAEVERCVDAFIDGESAAEDRASLQAHLADCPACAERVRFHSRFKTMLRESCPPPQVPDGLRTRLTAALAHEQDEQRRAHRILLTWSLAPAALVAIIAGVMTVSHRAPSSVATEAIARYQRDLPIEVAGGAEQVRAWFNHKVDFAVHPPKLPRNASLRGARLANIRDRQAADLLYDVDGQKVSVFVFDPGDLRLDGRRERQIGNRRVFLDGERGYHVAVFRDHDVGYAFTSDMDEDHMLQLVSAAVHE